MTKTYGVLRGYRGYFCQSHACARAHAHARTRDVKPAENNPDNPGNPATPTCAQFQSPTLGPRRVLRRHSANHALRGRGAPRLRPFHVVVKSGKASHPTSI